MVHAYTWFIHRMLSGPTRLGTRWNPESQWNPDPEWVRTKYIPKYRVSHTTAPADGEEEAPHTFDARFIRYETEIDGHRVFPAVDGLGVEPRINAVRESKRMSSPYPGQGEPESQALISEQRNALGLSLKGDAGHSTIANQGRTKLQTGRYNDGHRWKDNTAEGLPGQSRHARACIIMHVQMHTCTLAQDHTGARVHVNVCVHARIYAGWTALC